MTTFAANRQLQQADRYEETARQLAYLFPDGSSGYCLEICVRDSRKDKDGRIGKTDQYPRSHSAFVDSAKNALRVAKRIGRATTHIGFNPVSLDLLSYANNDWKATKNRTKDSDVESVRWFLIDIDPVRLPDISSTDEELAAAKEVLDAILFGNPELAQSAIWGSSGNGYYLLIRVPDLPNVLASTAMVKAAIEHLAAKYSTDQAKIDTATANPSRGLSLAGTTKTKGDSTANRPHRKVTLDSPPGPREPLDLAEWLTEHVPDWDKRSASQKGGVAATVRGTAKTDRAGRDRAIEAYVANAVKTESDAVSRAVGERNNQLNISALALGELVGAGVLSETEATQCLLSAALLCGLSEPEATRTIASGLKKGISQPRDLSHVGTTPKVGRHQLNGSTVEPCDLASIQGKVDAAVAAGDLTLIYRDVELVEMLPRIKREHPAEIGAMKLELANIKGFSSRDFDAAVRGPKPQGRISDRMGKTKYEDDDGNLPISILKEVDGEQVSEQLCNFSARIIESTFHDNGSETTRHLRIRATNFPDKLTREVDVPAAKYDEMRWVAGLGPTFTLEAGPGVRDHTRCAIQHLSGQIPERTIFGHTGWRVIDGSPMYLHSDGAIGKDGEDRSITVGLTESLAKYRLPTPPVGEERIKAVRASLGILAIAQPERPMSTAAAAALICAPYRAVIDAANFALQVTGPTGSYKSSAVALAQQHFGREMNCKDGLPAGWDSTANRLEVLAHQAKDAILTIDDFVPGGSTRHIDDLHKTAERVYRSQGNRAGRQRLRSDGTQAPDRPARTLIISTGEDRVRRKSADARTLPIAFRKSNPGTESLGTIDPKILSACQQDADAGLYAASLAAYVQHLAGRHDEACARLAERTIQLRPQSTSPGDHGRTPDIVASLFAAFEIFVEFAVEVGAISVAECERHRNLVWTGLLEASAEARADYRSEASISDTFIRLITAALTSGQAHLASLDGDVPDGREAASGWRKVVRYQGDVGFAPVWETPPNAKRIGWTDGTHVYLDPTNAYSTVNEIAGRQGEPFPASLSTLTKQLHDEGKLSITDPRNAAEGRNRYTTRKTIEKRRCAVLVLLCHEFWPSDTDESGPQEDDDVPLF